MASDRIQRRIDLLLDEADEAVSRLDWSAVRDRAQAVLAFAPEHREALAYLDAARRAQDDGGTSQPELKSIPDQPIVEDPQQPSSFANGRYQVKRFLGEGVKKKV